MKPRPNTAIVRTVGRVAAVVATVLLVGGLGLLAAWPPINDVTTGRTPQYPEIQPRDYSFSRPRVLAAAVESIEALPRFELVEADEESGTIDATASTRSGWFTDDVTVRIEHNGEAGAIVFIRSRSRVGRGDFGQNARNILALQEAMDENLGVR